MSNWFMTESMWRGLEAGHPNTRTDIPPGVLDESRGLGQVSETRTLKVLLERAMA